MTKEEIISEEMEGIRLDLVERYRAAAMKASGQFEQETKTVKRGGSHVIEAPSYAEQLIKGRKPGTMPPVQQIEEWIKTKGIKAIEQTMTITSLAWAIAISIKEKGTKYFQQGGTDLLDAVITPQRIQRIIDRLSDFSITELTTNITRTLKTAA